MYTLRTKGAHCPSPKAQRIPVKESEEKEVIGSEERQQEEAPEVARREVSECSWGPAAHPTPAFWGEALPEAPRRKPITPPLHHST